MRYHFIRGVIESGAIQVRFIEGSNQIADGFTKSLPKPKFLEFCDRIGLVEYH